MYEGGRPSRLKGQHTSRRNNADPKGTKRIYNETDYKASRGYRMSYALALAHVCSQPLISGMS